MDIGKILTYINIQPGQEEDKLRDFFELDEVRDFIVKKWEEYNSDIIELNPPDTEVSDNHPAEDEINKDEENKDEVKTNENINENIMSLIPRIPDDEETKARQRGKYTDPKDEALDFKLKSKFVQLQNGKVNQPYTYLFDITIFEIADIGDFWFEGLDELGLEFNKTTDMIEGTPSQAGDYKIVLKCKRTTWKEGDPVFERPITLIINPDPRSLWNDIPTPEDILYYKSDSACEYQKVEMTSGFLGLGKKPRKDIVVASQRGRSHAHEGKPRDDDFKICHQQEGGWYVMSVADGAGSAKFSREGSRIACETVSGICFSQLGKYNKEVENIIKDFERDQCETKRKKLGDALYNIIGSAVFKAYKNIEREALESGNHIKDYSTTLLVTITKSFKFGWFVASFWVGDGGIGIYNQDTQYLKIMGEPDGGEFAGQTRFLTMPEIMQPTEIYKRLRFEIVEDFTAIVLMTDGVTDPKFETEANLMKIEKWNSLWQDINSSVELKDDNEAAAGQLLKWLDFWSPGNHDDRTIAILY